MTHSLYLTPTAEADVDAVFVWYEEQRASLGERFLAAADAIFMRIRSSPGSFPEIATAHRRALLGRFPYGVYFSVERDRIVVKAILHLHRDPGAWTVRLSRRGR